MNEERCVCCNEIIPEGRQLCVNCEQMIIKVGTILQSRNATAEEVANAYSFLENIKEDPVE